MTRPPAHPRDHALHSAFDDEHITSTVVHAMAGPLQVIAEQTRALLEATDQASRGQRAKIERIAEVAERLQRMVTGALSHSRSRSEEVQLERVWLDDVVTQARQALAPLIEDRAATIRVTGTLPIVVGDRGLLLQVFENLLSNAVRYGPDGGLVRIRVLRSPRSWRVRVSDQGPGISPEHHELAFQPFRRLRGSGDQPGIGLGLTIAREAAERLGGSLVIDRARSAGATFVFTLPDQRLQATRGRRHA